MSNRGSGLPVNPHMLEESTDKELRIWTLVKKPLLSVMPDEDTEEWEPTESLRQRAIALIPSSWYLCPFKYPLLA